MRFHCTKKLFDKLDLPDEQMQTNSESELIKRWINWHANVVTIQRRQNLIFVNDATRFAVFLPCITTKQLKNLPLVFQDFFINSLLKAELPTELIEKAASSIQSENYSFDSECSRSVQGTMRLMVLDVEITLNYRNQKITELLPYSTSVMLSDRPCTVKGIKEAIWPIREMAQLLKQLPAV
ncbi:hypothetical protein H1D31_01480 [Alishewanella sp. BS5-314]|uniref:DUF6933 domain-containing protein n=1 Tax=Alishewanella sp. BS5-314 TaxID=2755587 RepID=UPI0021BA4DBD|nr:hypothetical protein [Alishewanella sp. BS5-314]MCT8124708.1 hypothetical protein [Alishewanella sp. BS5-314]